MNEEDGATAVIVAILLVVLLGFAALVVDAGNLYAERRELQNGAEAAVLAVAENCASGDTESACDTGPQGNRYTTAQLFADANAEDDRSNVDSNPTGVDVNYASSRATVTATTIDAATGNSFITHWFASLIGTPTTEVGAKATAIWGPLSFGSIPTVPLTMSQCEYDLFVNSGTGHAEEPWTEANNGAARKIFFHGGANNNPTPDCPAGMFDQDADGRLAGGFGWLDNGGGCSADIDSAGYVGEDPGASPDHGACSPQWMYDNIYQNVVLLPIFDDVNGLGGNNGEYRVYTYAAFYVTGYNFGGQYKTPDASLAPCHGQFRCIEGWFTTAAVADGEIDPNGPDTGVRAVQLTE